MSTSDTRSEPSKPTTLLGRVENALGNPGQAVLYVAKHAIDKDLTQVAASLTYTTILAIVPMLTVVLALFTAFPLFADFRIALEQFLANNLMPPSVSDSIMEYLNLFAAKASGLTTIGTLFLLVVSVSLIMTIDTTLNNIWNVEHQRPFRQRILVYWAIITLGPILAGASLWTTSLVSQHTWLRFEDVTPGLSVLMSLIPIIITGLGLSALFAMVPNRHVEWRDALAGGFGAALVLAIMRAGFAFYLSRFPSYTVIYGAFATLPIFLLWIYLSWLGILFGATLAATLPSLRLKRWTFQRMRGAEFVDALRLMRLLRDAQSTSSPGRSVQFLTAQLQLHLDELYGVLDSLQTLGYVVCTHDSGDELWVLSCDTDRVPLGHIIDALIIDRTQPGLVEQPQLLSAVAASMTSEPDVSLAHALDCLPMSGLGSNPIPQSPVIRQNTNIAPLQERHHVKSQ